MVVTSVWLQSIYKGSMEEKQGIGFSTKISTAYLLDQVYLPKPIELIHINNLKICTDEGYSPAFLGFMDYEKEKGKSGK